MKPRSSPYAELGLRTSAWHLQGIQGQEAVAAVLKAILEVVGLQDRLVVVVVVSLVVAALVADAAPIVVALQPSSGRLISHRSVAVEVAVVAHRPLRAAGSSVAWAIFELAMLKVESLGSRRWMRVPGFRL